MLTWEDDVEVHALRKRGWTISAIARHTCQRRPKIDPFSTGEFKGDFVHPSTRGQFSGVADNKNRVNDRNQGQVPT